MSDTDDFIGKLRKMRMVQDEKLLIQILHAVEWIEKHGVTSAMFTRNVIHRTFLNMEYEVENQLSVYVSGDDRQVDELCLYDNKNKIPHIKIEDNFISGLEYGQEEEVRNYYNRIMVVIENSLGMSIGELTEGHMGYVV